jgi:hypothetical protein
MSLPENTQDNKFLDHLVAEIRRSLQEALTAVAAARAALKRLAPNLLPPAVVVAASLAAAVSQARAKRTILVSRQILGGPAWTFPSTVQTTFHQPASHAMTGLKEGEFSLKKINIIINYSMLLSFHKSLKPNAVQLTF